MFFISLLMCGSFISFNTVLSEIRLLPHEKQIPPPLSPLLLAKNDQKEDLKHSLKEAKKKYKLFQKESNYFQSQVIKYNKNIDKLRQEKSNFEQTPQEFEYKGCRLRSAASWDVERLEKEIIDTSKTVQTLIGTHEKCKEIKDQLSKNIRDYKQQLKHIKAA